MKKIIVTILLIAGFFTTAVLVSACNSKKTEQQVEEEHQHNDEEMNSTATIYACPMHPEITGKKGDTCSKCGMKLEPVTDTDSTEVHNDHDH